ncbi:TPA: hypothetical protein ACMDV6_004830 [Vibrio parahaemolyticus]
MCFEGMVRKVKISISSEEFVNEFSELKRILIEGYFSEGSDISRLTILKEAGIEAQQLDVVKGIVDDSLTDALYTILLGLDGCASIGKHQVEYKLQDESGRELTGDLEELAYEALQESHT